MKNISFQLTTDQIKNRSKTVTRRLGWRNLKVGDVLQACEKCMGRKNGEPLVKLGAIRVVSVRREPLNAITNEDCVKEGFPFFSSIHFITMFCEEMKCQPETIVTRIEFEYL